MADTSTTKKSFKDTLNLPKTGFPMRANLAQNEPASLKRWRKEDLYAKIQAAREGEARFAFHDGPPYANGSIHVGHLLNKVLKDLVVRTRTLMGRSCPYVPGWDCHGLPIEHRVMTEMVESGKIDRLKELDEDTRRMAVRKACRAYAEKFVRLQSEQLQRLLTLGDYDEPYLTMAPEYEARVLDVFAGLLDRGLVYRALKPVHWSIANQTALAEAELEYEDRDDPSIYVDFEAVDREAVGRAFGVELDERPSFMIWTTTPWTLPANLAIAVHEEFAYVLVRLDGALTVIAKDLLERVRQATGAEDADVLAEAKGSDLLGLEYRHPFCPRTGRVVAAPYVTLEDGTGLVHTAPGHGAEDYQTGLKEGLAIYCPVGPDGRYDDTVPEWLREVDVWTANSDIVAHLQNSGHLVRARTITHAYPHDWRSKTPTIFRATEQWFVGVDRPVSIPDFEETGRGPREATLESVESDTPDTLRSMALRAIDAEVEFVPEWGRRRLRGMLGSRPDWCLSRQRAWGLPIPAFENEGGEVLMTPASVRAVARVVEASGSDAWFTEPVENLLAAYDPAEDADAPAWAKDAGEGLATSLAKRYDIFDVWFESGSSWNAVVRARGLGYPADLYLEGSDQHRGWFQLSLLPALGVTGRPPFRAILTHGFMVDKEGRKMSKSQGNALNVEDLLKSYGADVLRWWVASLSYEGDIKVDPAFFDAAGESYRKVRNTLRFLLSNLFDFGPDAKRVALTNLPPASLDAYLLHELKSVQERVLAAYEAYDFRRAHALLHDFCNSTLSSFYLAATKDRLYCDKADSPRRRATQTVMQLVADALCRLLAPILPHTAEEAYRALHGEDTPSVHLKTAADLPEVEIDADWPALLGTRDLVLKRLEDAKARGVENPLDAEVVLPDPNGTFAKFRDDLPDVFGVSRVRLLGEEGELVINDLRDAPRCERSWRRDETVKQRADGRWLTDRDADAIGAA